MARRPGRLGVVLAGGLALGLVLALTLGPIAVLGARAGPGAGIGPAGWAAVRFTLLQSLLSAAISVAVAIPFARALARRRFPGREALVALTGAPFLLPAIVAVFGLLAIWGRSGVLSEISQTLGGPRLSIYGLAGVVLAHVFYNVPLVTRLLLQGWQAIPAERFRLAAQLGLTPGAVFATLEWPLIRAVVPGAFALVFLLSMTSFTVALTLGGGPSATTVELAIYQAIRFDFDLAQAARLALVQVALCTAVALGALALGRPPGLGAGVGRPVERWDAPSGMRRALDAGAIALVFAFLALPILAVAFRGLPAVLGGLPAGLWPALGASLAVAAASAAGAAAAALALAGLIAGLPHARGAAVEGAAILILAASPFVIGTGLFIVIRPIADPFDWALTVTATINAAVSLPFLLRALVPAMTAVAADYGRLADGLGLGPLARWRLVIWPAVRRPLGFGAGLVAALSMGDLGVIALFAPPDVETLPLYMYRLMGSYRMDEAAGVALTLLAASLALFLALDRGGRLGHSL